MSNGSSINKIWIALAIALTVLAVAIFGAYAHYLPEISNDHAAWSSFGSLLSGVFTLAGVLATIATLLFLNAQNKNQQGFIEWQKQAMTFDQYINHRKLFLERLSELQTVCDNKIRFHNPERLYNSLFPDNLPTSLHLTAKAIRTGEKENATGSLYNMLERINTDINGTQWDDSSVRSFVYDLLMIIGFMQVEWIGESTDGDILVEGKNTGINIYSLDEFLSRCKLIFNSFLFYTGNPLFEGFGKGNPRYIREALIACFSKPWKDWPIKSVKTIDGLSTLEYLLPIVDSLRDEKQNWILSITYRHLEKTFSSRDEVLKLHNHAFLAHLINQCTEEAEWTLGLLSDHGKYKDKMHELLHCAETLHTLRYIISPESEQD